MLSSKRPPSGKCLCTDVCRLDETPSVKLWSLLSLTQLPYFLIRVFEVFFVLLVLLIRQFFRNHADLIIIQDNC